MLPLPECGECGRPLPRPKQHRSGPQPWKCKHKTATDHQDKDGAWICSVCHERFEWTDESTYFGNLECKKCWVAAIDFVLCSSACAAEEAPPESEEA